MFKELPSVVSRGWYSRFEIETPEALQVRCLLRVRNLRVVMESGIGKIVKGEIGPPVTSLAQRKRCFTYCFFGGMVVNMIIEQGLSGSIRGSGITGLFSVSRKLLSSSTEFGIAPGSGTPCRSLCFLMGITWVSSKPDFFFMKQAGNRADVLPDVKQSPPPMDT
uniref:SFRICE_022646 n=1 Tax=Spodoptera frugiperda TaxID=7108 RepID=A0A2H1WYC0_SPOFR